MTIEYFHIAPGEFSAVPTKLLLSKSTPEPALTWHENTEWVPEVELVVVKNMYIGGLGVFYDESGKMTFPRNVFPEYVSSMLNGTTDASLKIWRGCSPSEADAVKVLQQEVIFPFHPNIVYGHVLLEMLPKFLLLLKFTRTDVPIVVSSKSPTWFQLLVNSIKGEREVVYYDHSAEILLCEHCVTSTSMLGRYHSLHSMAVSLINELKRGLSIRGSARPAGNAAGTSKIFISRSRHAGGWHGIANSEEVERCFESHNFEIVHPELHTFKAQVELFSRANVIAGEYGSAMHNSMFSPSRSRVLCLNWINWYQSKVCSAFGQSVGYLAPIGGRFVDFTTQSQGYQSMEFDCDAISALLSADEF